MQHKSNLKNQTYSSMWEGSLAFRDIFRGDQLYRLHLTSKVPKKKKKTYKDSNLFQAS